MSFDLRIFNGDLQLDNGDLEKVEGLDKLIQDVLKIIMTPVGGNVFFPWYGSFITSSLVGNPLDNEFMESVAQAQVSNALLTLQQMQRDQMASNQRVTGDELLAAVQSVILDRNIVDPTYISLRVRIATKNLRSTEVTLNLTTL